MLRHISIAIRLALITLLITGVVYPLVITGIAQAAFPSQANGSLIKRDVKVVGSDLIGQRFAQPRYFHPRPSAAGEGYDATASGGSNLGPTSKKLFERVNTDISNLRKENPNLAEKKIPADMVTTSGSGLDPDITPANAYAQIPRIAKSLGVSEGKIKRLVEANTTRRQFGVLGEPRVNVLKINMALDSQYKAGMQ